MSAIFFIDFFLPNTTFIIEPTFLLTVKTYFKRGKIAIDKFHFTRCICWEVENVRKRVQKELARDKRRYYRRGSKLLLAKYGALASEQKDKLEIMF